MAMNMPTHESEAWRTTALAPFSHWLSDTYKFDTLPQKPREIVRSLVRNASRSLIHAPFEVRDELLEQRVFLLDQLFEEARKRNNRHPSLMQIYEHLDGFFSDNPQETVDPILESSGYADGFFADRETLIERH